MQNYYIRAMSKDALKTTHPINVEINDPHETETVFDLITYGKGGSVVRMIKAYIGQEAFQE